MSSIRYLNTILTVLAVLLGLQLWTGWVSADRAGSTTGLVSEAHAQGLPDAGAQRRDMVRELQAISRKLDNVQTLLTAGKVRVRLEEAAVEDEKKK